MTSTDLTATFSSALLASFSVVLRRGFIAALLLTTGCTVGPDYHAPQTQTPGSFGELASALPAAGDKISIATGVQADLSSWWTAFGDDTLNNLVERAIGANLDLQRARAAVRQARAQRGVIGAGLWPKVDATGSFQRSRSSSNGLSQPSPGTEQSLFQAGFDATWELDVFGGVRRGIEAADADVGAAIEDERDMLVVLLGEVALNYVQLRGTQRQLAIAHANLAAQNDTLDIARTRFQAGLVPDLDVAQAQAQVATTEAQIPVLEAAQRQAIHQLGVLLGQEPMALSAELSPEAPIPIAPHQVPVGLP